MTEDQRLAVQLLIDTGFRVLRVEGRTAVVTWPVARPISNQMQKRRSSSLPEPE